MANNKILLINSNLMKPPVTPIGLDYIGSILMRNGFNVELLDLNFSKNIKDDIKKKLANNSFLAVGINIRNTDDCYYLSQDFFLPKIKDIVRFIRKYSEAPLFLGGGGFSIAPLEITKYLGADYGIIGDGEITSLRLLESIKSNNKDPDLLEKIKGVVFKDSDYKKVEPECSILKDYPLADRDLVDNKRYFAEGGMGSIETKRGCSRNCIYCADPIIKGRKIRVRPVKTVIKELKNLIDKGINYLHFCDSEFNLPIDYATDLLSQIIDSDIRDKIKWYSYMSPVPFNDSFAKLLKRAGCEGINFGVDSAYPEVLKNLRRKHSLNDLITIAELCSKYKIKFMFDLLLGGPGEDRDSIKYTIDNIKKLNPTCAGISYGIRVYPGTSLARSIKREILPGKKNLYGNVKNNTNFFKPVFYISEEVGKDIVEYTNNLVDCDKKFFIGATDKSEKNYNYNENLRLQEAIKSGYRGSFWDILQQIN
ncbi:MAG: radical SAM protein [Actinobacteria bacterium]|nr:radical SAM protein [Actinomycetota bacterium]MBM3712570.1 radical SAM protein [Actinomycetota bacterium]